MAFWQWVDKHPFLSFFLASSAIGGVVAIATAPFKAAAAQQPATAATALTPNHRYQIFEPLGPNSTPNTVVQAQTAIDAQIGVGLFRVESIAQHGSQLVTTVVYTGTTPLALGSVVGAFGPGVKFLDLGPA